VSSLLDRQQVVTLLGPGGVGKTRLALEVALRRSADTGIETCFVDLTTVDRPELVTEVVARSLGIGSAAASTSAQVMEDALRGRSLLLVLDNFEHVVAAASVVADVARAAPGVRLLVTSRARLRIPGEHVFDVSPLKVRDDTGPADAVTLFAQAATAIDPAFRLGPNLSDVTAICRMVDGLPLAIELAAGQVAVLPPAALRDRLGRALDALSAERPAGDARHRTLRTTIDWSYRLLEEGERALLRALATYPAGADLETVEALASRAVPGTDPLVALRRLVDASLVSPAVSPAASGRYDILETVRAFLLDDAGARGERDGAEREFLEWARRTAVALGLELSGPDEAAADRRLRAELPNLRAARDLARARGDLDLVVDVTLALDEATTFRNLEEVWRWSVELAEDPAMRGHPREAAVLGSASEAAWLSGDLPLSRRLCAAGLAAVEHTREPEAWRRCRYAAGAVALFEGRFDAARASWEDAAAVAPQPTMSLASAALAATYGGDRAGALDLVRRAEAAERARPCTSHLAFVRYAEGEAVAGSDPAAAIAAYTAAIDGSRVSGAGFVEGVAMVGLASVWAATGDVAAAVRGYLMLLDYWNHTGSETQLWTTLRNVARLLLGHGLHADAALLLAAADGAASASRLTGDDAAQAEAEQAVLAEQLGAGAVAALRARAAGLTAAGASAVAREALARIPAGPAA
jgi:predicted ATPase